MLRYCEAKQISMTSHKAHHSDMLRVNPRGGEIRRRFEPNTKQKHFQTECSKGGEPGSGSPGLGALPDQIMVAQEPAV